MKAVILAGGRGSRLSEETGERPKPMVEIGGKPILWHIMKLYSAHGIDDFVICLGYKGYLIKEYFANYALHTSDVTFDMARGSMEVHESTTEPWRVTLVDTGEATATGGRVRRGGGRRLGGGGFFSPLGGAGLDGGARVDDGAVAGDARRHRRGDGDRRAAAAGGALRLGRVVLLHLWRRAERSGHRRGDRLSPVERGAGDRDDGAAARAVRGARDRWRSRARVPGEAAGRRRVDQRRVL